MDAGVHKSGMSRILLGHYSLTPIMAIKLSEALNYYGYSISPLKLLNHQNKYLLVSAKVLIDNGF